MRTLSAALLAAQQSATHEPVVSVTASNRVFGAVRLDWERLYTGAEPDYYHALAMAGDGSMVRARLTLPGDTRKLYRQRVASPGSGADFSQWTYTGQYNCVVLAAAALENEVSIFWTNTSREIRRIKSTDYGVTWGSPELIDYSPTIAINGLAAAYKPNGDLAVFFADQATLYVKKRVGGSWQAKAAWDKATGDLSGVAAVYDGDWDLLVTGRDAAGNYKLWALVYGDGGQVPAGTWSALSEMATAPGDGDFTFGQTFLDKPDVWRAFFIEHFAGSQAYDRPLWSHSVAGAGFGEGLWREPVTCNLASQYGLAMAHDVNHCWLSAPYGVWRAAFGVQSIELTADVLALKMEASSGRGGLTVELRNDDGRYTTPPAPLARGCQVEVSPGYRTPSGEEVSAGPAFVLESLERTSAPGKATLVLSAGDGWDPLAGWSARSQLRWNKSSNEKSVRDLLAWVLARVGIRLDSILSSSAAASLFSDFTALPGDRGDALVARLLSLIPDLLRVEGSVACLIDPQPAEAAVYSYGTGHAVLEGRFRDGSLAVNRLQVEGYDPAGGGQIIVDSFAWDEVDRLGERLETVRDRNLTTAAAAQQRGEAVLRKAAIESGSGTIVVPVNCGQQVYDVIEVTDTRSGLVAAKRRVLGITLLFRADKGQYQQRLALGQV